MLTWLRQVVEAAALLGLVGYAWRYYVTRRAQRVSVDEGPGLVDRAGKRPDVGKPAADVLRARKALLGVFQQPRRSGLGREYTIEHLTLLAGLDTSLLVQALEQLAKEGVVQRVFRVESPSTHAGLQDFESILDVPERIHDRTSDEDIEVGPELIRPIIKLAVR